MVQGGVPLSSACVRQRFNRLRPLKEIDAADRGWTLDVLNVVRGLRKVEFENGDVYAESRKIESLHPDNRHIRDKIRQQLQFLRDAGFIEHVERGRWRVRETIGAS